MTRFAMVIVLSASMLLSACGSSTGDRAASGAGIGAAAGTALGLVTGLGVVEGALIGAAAGGLLGGLTDEDTINLGDPIWAEDDKPANSSAVGRVQTGLTRLGYDPGPIDGKMGSRTRGAIETYQRDHGLVVDGRASAELARHIEGQLQVADNN